VAEQPGIELQRVEPLLFGRVRPFWLLSSGALLLLVAIALLALADWVLGPLLLLLALLLLGLYLVAARRLPPSRFARGAVGGVRRGRDEIRFAVVYAGAWTRAGWRVACVERERRRLRRERDAAQYELGGATYGKDEPEAERLRARMMELDELIAACVGRVDESREAARERVALARVPLRPTEISPPRDAGQTQASARREG
jgi:hypothetical protein